MVSRSVQTGVGRMGDWSALNEDEREATQIASLIGRTFYALGGARDRYDDEALDKVERAGANLAQLAREAKERRK